MTRSPHPATGALFNTEDNLYEAIKLEKSRGRVVSPLIGIIRHGYKDGVLVSLKIKREGLKEYQ